jgi:hypothetical protein
MSNAIIGVHALAAGQAFASTHVFAGVSAIVGPSPTVTGVRDLALVHAVAGTHAVECGSVVFGPTVAGVLAL